MGREKKNDEVKLKERMEKKVLFFNNFSYIVQIWQNIYVVNYCTFYIIGIGIGYDTIRYRMKWKHSDILELINYKYTTNTSTLQTTEFILYVLIFERIAFYIMFACNMH